MNIRNHPFRLNNLLSSLPRSETTSGRSAKCTRLPPSFGNLERVIRITFQSRIRISVEIAMSSSISPKLEETYPIPRYETLQLRYASSPSKGSRSLRSIPSSGTLSYVISNFPIPLRLGINIRHKPNKCRKPSCPYKAHNPLQDPRYPPILIG